MYREFYEIIWQPDKCSVTFHGRDVFAPVAASLYQQQTAELLRPVDTPDLSHHPDDLHQVIYLDHYGNAMTGINYHDGLNGLKLIIKGRQIEQAGTFSHVKAGELFWYKNSLDLVEIAANQSSAKNLLNIQLADTVTFEQS